jgi:hypothetical protein
MPVLQYGAGAAVTQFPAADADGDGIADSLFFAIPGASYDGLTWYAAVRIIDNNSAINANTAWSRDTLTVGTAGSQPDYWNLFQTSTGLAELINTGDSGTFTSKFNAYRFGAGSTGNAGLTAVDDTGINGNVPPGTYDRTNTSKDYSFISPSEAYYMQLIRRIANPGVNSNGGARYQPFPLSDEAALAYHFCLQNPNSMSQSVLESVLPNSLDGTGPTTSVPSTPYDPSQTNTATTDWFPANFNYPLTTDALVAPMSLRPLLVTHNPVSNYIQQVYDNSTVPTNSEPILPNYMLPYGVNTTTGAPNPSHFRGIWGGGSPPGPYAVNDVVIYPGTAGTPYNGPSSTYVAIAANAATAPATLSANNVITGVNAGWKLQPWTSNPVKANVNTATFPALFRAFWSVMAGNPSNATPFGATGPAAGASGIYDNTPTDPQFMFRSPLRDPGTTGAPATSSQLDVAPAAGAKATNTNAMLLRAALAAINTLGLRDNSQNVISRTITLINPSQIDTGPTPVQNPVELQVFSSAPQPVISEIYASTFTGSDSGTSTSNPQGYVAVELYNPYPVTLTLTNWQLGLINRNPTGSNYPNLSFQTNPTTPPVTNPNTAVSVIGPMTPLNDPTIAGAATTLAAGYPIKIPPHGYALLENFNGSGSGTHTTDDATCRPIGAVSIATAGPPATQGSFTIKPAAPAQIGIWYGPNGPGTATIPANTCDVYVPNLQLVMQGTQGVSSTGAVITSNSTGGELVLLRPRQVNGIYGNSTDPTNTFNEGTSTIDANGNGTVTVVNLWDLVPVDSYDFTGLKLPTAAPFPVWSYVRMKGATSSLYFKQFFPGFYDATKPTREGAGTGTQSLSILAPASDIPPWTTAVPSFGYDNSTGSYTNPFPPIQIYNVAAGNAALDPMHFPNAVVSPLHPYPNGIVPAVGTNLFPLGGFARNGDMLDIPFIGAYRVRISGGANDQVSTASANYSTFLEMNSLPMDCSLAAVETGNVKEDVAQNVGRFVPMAATFQYVSQLEPTPPTPPLPDYYAWTRNLFNYLTVQSSTDAYLPNFDPNLASVSTTGTPIFAYPPQNTGGANPVVPPTPTLTANATAPDQTLQDNVGVEGLININTASWKVLSMLPFVSPSVAGFAATDRQIAQNIVNYRLTYGPFTSIYDLNQVPGFQSGTNVAWTPPTLPVPTQPTAPTSQTGLLSPADQNFGTGAASATASGLGEDYQGDCLTLTRISNLVTTRSDTFTVYVEVQGWQNVGLPNAQPMVTRRYAFIVDRSAISGDPSTRFLKTLTVPND